MMSTWRTFSCWRKDTLYRDSTVLIWHVCSHRCRWDIPSLLGRSQWDKNLSCNYIAPSLPPRTGPGDRRDSAKTRSAGFAWRFREACPTSLFLPYTSFPLVASLLRGRLCFRKAGCTLQLFSISNLHKKQAKCQLVAPHTTCCMSSPLLNWKRSLWQWLTPYGHVLGEALQVRFPISQFIVS